MYCSLKYQKVLMDILSNTNSEFETHILDNKYSIKNRLMELFYYQK